MKNIYKKKIIKKIIKNEFIGRFINIIFKF